VNWQTVNRSGSEQIAIMANCYGDCQRMAGDFDVATFFVVETAGGEMVGARSMWWWWQDSKNPPKSLNWIAPWRSKTKRNKCRRPSEASYAGFVFERSGAFQY